MNSRLLVISLILSLAALTGCESNPLGVLFQKSDDGSFECRMVEPSEAGDSYTIDDKLAAISESVEGGFGGYYYNREEDVLAIYMLEPDNQEAAEEIRSRLVSYFGKSDEWKETELRVLQGEYTAAQLKEWKDLSTNIVSIPGVHMQDLHEGGNEVLFGVSSEADDPEAIKDCIMENADNLGIPRGAVGTEIRPPAQRL